MIAADELSERIKSQTLLLALKFDYVPYAGVQETHRASMPEKAARLLLFVGSHASIGAMGIKNSNSARRLGRWISAGLSRLGMGSEQFAQNHLPPSSRRSFYNWAAGRNIPQAASHAELERGLGWKPGAVMRILSSEAVREEEVFLPDLEAIARKAENLTDEDLLEELGRRFREAKAQAGL
ncbi:hypothetical protein [Paenarthrobacter ureafaciens]|uniref:hypothetical protein n=1 Tax=Paenarthrobacter ureafaciens TaxID=37931 RepID=UPI0034646743